jgi:hypothetical protein
MAYQTNAEIILDFLESISPKWCCDDHLSESTGVAPRQQARQIAEKLSDRKQILRQQGVCDFHPTTRHVWVSSWGVSPSTASPSTALPSAGFPYEDRWAQLDVFLKSYWSSFYKQPPDKIMARLISDLSNANKIPQHQANMMHIIRNLRNVVVHEHVVLGQREAEIASNAWEIICEWAMSAGPDLWRSATN